MFLTKQKVSSLPNKKPIIYDLPRSSPGFGRSKRVSSALSLSSQRLRPHAKNARHLGCNWKCPQTNCHWKNVCLMCGFRGFRYISKNLKPSSKEVALPSFSNKPGMLSHFFSRSDFEVVKNPSQTHWFFFQNTKPM